MCKEGNIRGVFGYPTKTEELATKYRISPHTIDNLISQFGSMENYIKEYRETIIDPIGMNLVINVSRETQSKGMNLLLQEIYINWTKSDSDKKYLVFVDGDNLLKALKTMPERNADILRYRFGLIDGRIYELGELSEMFGVTKERIKQIENKTISKLRQFINSSVVYSERDTEEQDFSTEEATRRKLLLDRIYKSNLIFVPDREYEQEPDNIQHSELREILTELKSIQPIMKEKEYSTQNKISESENLEGISIDALGLSTRAYRILIRARITTIEQLRATSTEELMAIRFAGTKSIEEIDAKLKELGIERTTSESTTIEDTPISFDSTTSINILGLSVRAYNVLTRAGITTIGQLSTTSTEELRNLRNAGRKTIEEIIGKLEELGIADADIPSKENTELEKLRAKKDELDGEVEILKQQTKSAEQLLASYDSLLNGTTQDNTQKTEAKGE